jgi:methionine sulfoxide reductase catalytic subunit
MSEPRGDRADDLLRDAPDPRDSCLPRREFLRRLGVVGVACAFGADALRSAEAFATVPPHGPSNGVQTDRAGGARGGRYLEFSDHAHEVERRAAGFATDPWRVRIDGVAARPCDLALGELVGRMPFERRPCGGAARDAGAGPHWTGFPLAALVRWARPLPSARYLGVVSFLRPDAAPNQRRPGCYPWPYREGLTLDEALDPRAFVATGLDGRALPPHRGAPLRLVLPWKRGRKSVKAIARFEFTERQPQTFWGELAPRECDFAGNRKPLA